MKISYDDEQPYATTLLQGSAAATSVGRIQTILTQAELAVIRTYPPCFEAKLVRRSYFSVTAAFKATRPRDLISADIPNPSTTSVGGTKYVLVIIDQYTRFIDVYVQKFIHPTLVMFAFLI